MDDAPRERYDIFRPALIGAGMELKNNSTLAPIVCC
jgi:hypothetical protein